MNRLIVMCFVACCCGQMLAADERCKVEFRSVASGDVGRRMVAEARRALSLSSDVALTTSESTRRLVFLFSTFDKGEYDGKPASAYAFIWTFADGAGDETLVNHLVGYADESYVDTLAESAVNATKVSCQSLKRLGFFAKRTHR